MFRHSLCARKLEGTGTVFSLCVYFFLPLPWISHKHNRLVWWSVTNISWCLAQQEHNKVKQKTKQKQRHCSYGSRDQNKLCGLAEVNMTHLCAPSWQQDAAECFLQRAKKQNLSAAPDNKQRIRVCEGTALCKQLCAGRFECRLHIGKGNVLNSKRQCNRMIFVAPLVSVNLQVRKPHQNKQCFNINATSSIQCHPGKIFKPIQHSVIKLGATDRSSKAVVLRYKGGGRPRWVKPIGQHWLCTRPHCPLTHNPLWGVQNTLCSMDSIFSLF